MQVCLLFFVVKYAEKVLRRTEYEKSVEKVWDSKVDCGSITAISCVGMLGCSEDRVRWNEGFSGAEIVGFIDDSLVMVGSYQMRTESHEVSSNHIGMLLSLDTSVCVFIITAFRKKARGGATLLVNIT